MAQKVFAELDPNNVVVTALVVSEDWCSQGDPSGEKLCKKTFKGHAYKESTSSDSSDSFRVRPAVKGGIYNPDADRFEYTQTYKGWLKRESDGEWLPPFPKPENKPQEVINFEALHPDRATLEIRWNNDTLNWQIGFMDFTTNEWTKFNWGENDTDWVKSVDTIPEGVTE